MKKTLNSNSGAISEQPAQESGANPHHDDSYMPPDGQQTLVSEDSPIASGYQVGSAEGEMQQAHPFDSEAIAPFVHFEDNVEGEKVVSSETLASVGTHGKIPLPDGKPFDAYFLPEPEQNLKATWKPDEFPSLIGESASPQTTLRSRSPIRNDGTLSESWDGNFLLDGKIIQSSMQGETGDIQEDNSNLPFQHAGVLEFLENQQQGANDFPIQTNAGVSPPTAPNIDPLPAGLLPTPLEQEETEGGVENFARALRRVRKWTDNVLMKRVQLQQERSKLADCRRFLHESTTELMSAMQNPNRLDGSHSHTRARRRRRRRRTAGVEIPNEAEPSDDRAVSSSAEGSSVLELAEVNRDGADSLGSDTTTASHRRLTEIFERYLDDFEALSKQERLEKKLTEDLSSREFHLEGLLKDIQANMHSVRFAQELRTEMLEGSVLSTESSMKTASEDELPPLVMKYFDLHGSIGICLERLQELDFAHQEGLTEREFVRERGDELNPPDEEFEANYQTQRQQTEDELNKARGELEQVAAQCKLAGLDPEAYRNVAPSPRSMSPIPSGRPGDTSRMPRKAPIEPAANPPLSPTTRGQTSLQIEGWLKELPDVPGQEESALPPPAIDHKTLPSAISLAGFEFSSFNVGVFGLPKVQEVHETTV